MPLISTFFLDVYVYSAKIVLKIVYSFSFALHNFKNVKNKRFHLKKENILK
jgi:hypothetical protein